jgi:hypothetical protein
VTRFLLLVFFGDVVEGQAVSAEVLLDRSAVLKEDEWFSHDPCLRAARLVRSGDAVAVASAPLG